MASGMSENDATLLSKPLHSLQPLQFFARTRTLNTHDDRARPDRLYLQEGGGGIGHLVGVGGGGGGHFCGIGGMIFE